LVAKTLDLGKKPKILPVSTFLVANGYETEWNQLPKAELLIANNAFWGPTKMSKVKTFKIVSKTAKTWFLLLTVTFS